MTDQLGEIKNRHDRHEMQDGSDMLWLFDEVERLRAENAAYSEAMKIDNDELGRLQGMLDDKTATLKNVLADKKNWPDACVHSVPKLATIMFDHWVKLVSIAMVDAAEKVRSDHKGDGS